MSGNRRAVALDQLLVEIPPPSTVESAEWRAIRDTEPTPELYASRDAVARAWTDRPPGPILVQFVYGYRTTGFAKWGFSGGWDSLWGNPDFNPSQPTDPYRSELADESHMMCADPDTESCGIWFYWARYGQYNIMLRYNFSAPIDEAEFKSLAAAMESQLSVLIGRV